MKDAAYYTEYALRQMSAREMVNILKMTGQYKPKPKPEKAVVLQVNPRFATTVVRNLRDEGIICLYEKYKHNGNFTVLKEDVKKVNEILSRENLDYKYC